MDSYRFEMLTLQERGELVFEDGVFLDSHVYYGARSNLYSYDQLFIEVRIGHDSECIESIEIVPLDKINRFLTEIKLPFTN